jgi:DNA invertase Pin-like site-specific DNA recombinase
VNAVNHTSSKDNHRTAVVYLRVASSDPADQEHALAVQREACEREAERLGAEIIDEFIDLGASGNNKSRGRLRRLLVAVRQRSVKYVIVRDHTRLTRNTADHRVIRQRLQQAGVALVAVDSGAHTQVTADDLLRSLR